MKYRKTAFEFESGFSVDKSILLVNVAHLAPTVLAVLAEKRCGARLVGSAHTRQETEFPAPSPFLTT